MPSPRTYATAGAFRRALEERLKRASLTDQIDPNRLRRQVSFDRLLARLFREDPAPWVLKGGYALELRFKAARSTVDIDLTVQRVAACSGGDENQVVRQMLQSAAAVALGDWFEFTNRRQREPTAWGPLPNGWFFRILRAWKYTSLPRRKRNSKTCPRRADAAPTSWLKTLWPDIWKSWREMLNSRYDDLKSDRVRPIPGDEVEAYFRKKSAAARRSQPGS